MRSSTSFRTALWGGLGGAIVVILACVALGVHRYIVDNRGVDVTPHMTSTSRQLVGFNAPDNFRTAARRSTSGVVFISTREQQALTLWDYYSGRRSRVQEGSGSGVLYTADGYIVTNNHVVKGAQSIEVSLNDDRRFAATLVGTYPAADLAVLKIEGESLPTLPFADSDGAQVGDWVLAVGNPYNLSSTVTAGIISARGRDVNIINDRNAIESFIQTDAAINPGNSGGALVNVDGEVIGINTAIYSRTGGYSGYGFAIPSNLAKRVVDDIIETGSFRQIVLGLDAVELDSEYAQALGLPVEQGILVEEVLDGGIAQAAGLRPQDIIIGARQRRIRAISEFRAAVSSTPRGQALPITVLRDGQERVVDLQL